MNINKLKGRIVESNIPLADILRLTGISESTYYNKMSGRTEFTQKEISGLSKVLCLKQDEIMSIFFDELVS